jgi:hypothetical protein
MVSVEETTQFFQTMHDLDEFTKMVVKKYPLLFKNGFGGIKIHPSIQHPFFPYEASLEITIKE